MKRLTVSLPDDLADRVKVAAGGEGRVSAYVAAALEAYQEGESLEEILADWRAETPVPEEVERYVEAELDRVGFVGRPSDERMAG